MYKFLVESLEIAIAPSWWLTNKLTTLLETRTTLTCNSSVSYMLFLTLLTQVYCVTVGSIQIKWGFCWAAGGGCASDDAGGSDDSGNGVGCGGGGSRLGKVAW